ncbi:uncharacterized protein LOC115956884 [Quercus lobata]|uniref:uncharacterized protein LOC115956884 n=1 Tax=Quercus lobata TaxID=97700 RepID=UPI0012455BAF|nr:uncharacterized protein LOC115956884 [Quercus lobata]
MDSVANYGKGLKLPTYDETRVTFLKKEVENMHFTLDKYKNEWKKTGCTLISDGWTDNRERSITNFLVNSPKGTVFLKSIDTSDISKNVENLFQLLDSLVQEIGEENVVQLVTDSALAYVSTGEKLMEKRHKIFWNPCAAHLKVLRLVDGDAKLAMGYIYEAMDRAKEQIRKIFNDVQRRYRPILRIIETRWKLQLHKPLHAAAYFLNPKFHYDLNFVANEEVRVGLYEVIERMCPTTLERCRIDLQLEKFDKAEGLFGKEMTILTRTKKQPALWWESYGVHCKELQNLAIHVLSLTCSVTGCKRNWSTFDHVHTKKRNRLEQQRMNALVFVNYNINLELRQIKREENGDSYDPICLSDLESDDEWITEKEEPCLPEDTSWMDIHECFEVNEEGCSRKRRRGSRNLNAKKKSKEKVIEVEEPEEIVDVGDDEEDVQEDANDEMILQDDEDDNFIDLDYGDDFDDFD